MKTTSEAFEVFRQRLELSTTEAEDAQRRHKDVRETIQAVFDIDGDFLTGSYARHTKTKPLKDVDIFFPLVGDSRKWREKAPTAILDAFQECLVTAYGKSAVERGRRCVTVSFDKKNPTVSEDGRVLSIDAVPAIDLGECYEIADGHLGRWIKSNPEVHAAESTAKNKALAGKWIPLVKMLKAWNRSAGKPIEPSFLVEVMAQDLVDGPFTTYPSEVRRFFAAALDGINQDWPDPAGYGPPVSDQMTSEKRQIAAVALRRAEVDATRAVRLEKEGRQGESLALWREILGRYFPST
ncbi:MAG: CBASS oligonucleotide cyclase [Archangium sp.]|nr:CBASS oligonucleotide cyclase [Archangium sp.]